MSVLALGVACTLVAAGCGGDDDDDDAGSGSGSGTEAPAGGAEGGDRTAACLMIDLSLEAFQNICEGVQEAGAANNVEVVLGDGQSDPAQQSTLMDSYITQEIDMVVVIAQDPGSLQAVIDRAQDEGVMVIALGTALDTADLGVISDFYAEGETIGQAVVEWVDQESPDPADILVTDFPATAVLQDRADGTQDAIEAGLPDANITRTSANSRDEGLQAMQAALQENPNIRIMTCISDDACLGGAQAMSEAGIEMDACFNIGTDATSSAYQALEASDSCFKATAGYGLKVFGAAGLIRGVDCLNGEDVEKDVRMNNQIVTAENLEEFRALDDDPVQTYDDFFDRYITVIDDTLAECPPANG